MRAKPCFFSDIFTITSFIRVLLFTTAALFIGIIKSVTLSVSFFPSLPPGCDLAKSFDEKPFALSKETAIASPKASITVVLAVGARSLGHASFDTFTFT